MSLLKDYEALCKYVRECTGDDIVCGLCEYDAAMECPGFESNECFVLKESLRKQYEMYDQVIRCKDCKWYECDEKLHCGLSHGVRLKDDYCSDAERRTDDLQ